MLLQTNSYIVPKDRRAEHARLLRRFKQVLTRLGCELFEVYEQMGPNWTAGDGSGRFVQIMRFRDRKHQREVHAAEQSDPAAQQLIAEFCELVNLPYQQQQGLLAIGYYQGVMDVPAAVIQKVAEGPAAAPPPPTARARKPDPKPRSAFGFGVPAAAAAAAAIPAGLGFGAGAAAPIEPEDEPAESPVDEAPVEEPAEPPADAEDEVLAESETLDEAAELPDFDVPEIAAPAVAATTAVEPEESEELSGLDFADEPTMPAFAEAPAEPAPAVADPEDDAAAVLDGLDFSELSPAAETPTDGLDALDLELPEESPAEDFLPADELAAEDDATADEIPIDEDIAAEDIAAEETPTEEAAADVAAEFESPATEAGDLEFDSAIDELTPVEAELQPAELQPEGATFDEVPPPLPADALEEAAAVEAIEANEAFAPVDLSATADAPAAADIVPEPLAADSSSDDWMSELDLPAATGEAEIPAEFRPPPIEPSTPPEAVAPSEEWRPETVEPSQIAPDTSSLEFAPEISPEVASAAESGAEFAVEPSAEAVDPSEGVFGLQSESETELPVAEATPETLHRGDLQDAAFVAAAPAAVNGHHDVHADADATDAPGDDTVEVAELPTTLMTDEGEIEILYEEFPENFDEEEPTAASDSEIDAALDEALRD